MQQIDAEIRGDWSNIRGTENHFVYALWRIIADHSPAVWFYKGNDLLASAEIETVAPPVFDEELDNDLIPSVPLRGGTEDTDEWIQLKATTKPWTPSEVLRDNLLFNFITNAYYSESKGRRWRVALISQGEVRSRDLIDFACHPSKTPELEKRLEKILTKSKQHLKEIGWSNTKRSREKLFDVVKTIFEQIAETDRVRRVAGERANVRLDKQPVIVVPSEIRKIVFDILDAFRFRIVEGLAVRNRVVRVVRIGGVFQPLIRFSYSGKFSTIRWSIARCIKSKVHPVPRFAFL